MSTKPGFALQYNAQFAEATKVFGEVHNRSSLPSPAARHAIWSAAVPLETATAYFAPQYLATADSNCSIKGPCVSQSLFKILTTFLISVLVTHCLPYRIYFIRNLPFLSDLQQTTTFHLYY